MPQFFDTLPDINVQDSEFQRLLGYPPNHVMEGRSLELAHRARQWFAENGKPWIYARQIDAVEVAQDRVIIDRVEFASKPLREQFASAKAHSVMLAVVSAGRQCEEKARELWQESKPDEYFFMEMFGSAVVEHLVTMLGGRICAEAEEKGMAVLPHYSPGYSGWDVADQIPLWKLIRRDMVGDIPGQLEVMDSGMLRPKKSLLAIFGITRHLDQVAHLKHMIPCENCSLPGCRYRRTPYKYSPPQIEDVRRLQSVPSSEAIATSSLDHAANYSINAKALRKWSQERLQLKSLHDGSLEASFRYLGTTCSNMGQPLEYDYHLKLASAEDGYRILEAVCAPAPGDIGHTSQCEYLSNTEELKQKMAGEKPLLGRPLNDVLKWKRVYSPSACYCDFERRAHKWGLVFEVIHFTLVQREKGKVNGQ